MSSNDPNEFDVVRRITVGNEMGRGKYLLVRHHRNERFYIEKNFERSKARIRAAEQEIQILLQAREGPYISKIKNYFTDPQEMCGSIWMEYPWEGSLSELIMGHAEKCLPVYERFCSILFQQLALAVDFLHRGGGALDWAPIMHRDISPKNVWLKRTDPDRAPTVQLSGFGCAQWKHNPQIEAHQGGDPDFRPPEYPNNDEFSDVYQMGQTMACLLALAERPPLSLRDVVRSGTYTRKFVEIVRACRREEGALESPNSMMLPDLLLGAMRVLDPDYEGDLYLSDGPFHNTHSR
ncbi:kinase-like protein [Byssothecium circinans]|uniref:Kinase-like protein n=1 Tax=Byssothecium circinans TaxID=147558 RepID=A0A6A5U9R3_9PLEO|nr:kinase-like protein [Byssothecium circinans]